MNAFQIFSSEMSHNMTINIFCFIVSFIRLAVGWMTIGIYSRSCGTRASTYVLKFPCFWLVPLRCGPNYSSLEKFLAILLWRLYLYICSGRKKSFYLIPPNNHSGDPSVVVRGEHNSRWEMISGLILCRFYLSPLPPPCYT